MIVYLMRHGIAEEWAESGRDRDRRLTDRGRKRLQQSGVGLKKLGLKPTAILTSPFARAAETATIIAAVLGCSERVQMREELQSGGDGEQHIREMLNPDWDEVLVVGHEPEMSLIAAELAGAGTQFSFKKGSVCRIDLTGNATNGEIIWLIPPKVLVEMGK